MTVTTPRPTLMIAAAAVMTDVITILPLLGLHIQNLCIQFVCGILNHLKVSRHFELVGKIWDRIMRTTNGFSPIRWLAGVELTA